MNAYREESIVRVSYVLEADEFVRAWKPYYADHLHPPRLALAATAALGGLVFLLTLPWGVSQLAMVIAAALVGWFAYKSRFTVSTQSVYGDTWEDCRHMDLEVTETEISIGNRLWAATLAWELIPHWRETETALLIYTAPETFYVIPKRVFTSKAQETVLRQLLTDHVSPDGDAIVTAAKRTSWIPTAVYHVGIGLFFMSLVEFFARVFSG